MKINYLRKSLQYLFAINIKSFYNAVLEECKKKKKIKDKKINKYLSNDLEGSSDNLDEKTSNNKASDEEVNAIEK